MKTLNKNKLNAYTKELLGVVTEGTPGLHKLTWREILLGILIAGSLVYGWLALGQVRDGNYGWLVVLLPALTVLLVALVQGIIFAKRFLNSRK